MIPKVKKYIFLVLYAFFLFGLSTIPPKELQSGPKWVNDKVVHFILYTGAGIAFYPALSHPLATWIATMVMGGADENYQRFTGRNCDFYDWVADALGGAFGTTLSLLYAKRRKQP